MEKFSISLILLSFALISGNIMIDMKVVNAAAGGGGGRCEYLEAIGGGCPDRNLCHETCRPCYVGIGVVLTYCVAPGGGINYWRCRCTFKKGAPCKLPGIACPAPGFSASQHPPTDAYNNKTAHHL